MLKAFCFGVASAIVLALTSVVLARPTHFDLVLPSIPDPETFLADESPTRSERSANISHILGVSRKIYIIMNRIGLFLQITPDGTVGGTDQDNDYYEWSSSGRYTPLSLDPSSSPSSAIFQRAALNNSKIKIQGVATCHFLCMDRCGLLYGSREFTDECIFNEVMEDHYFNTYSSAKYSNDKRTLYLALNKKGVPRKVQTKPNASLDKLEMYTNVLTKAVPAERVEALETKILSRLLFGKFLMNSKDDIGGHHHSLRHHHRYHQLCINSPMTKLDDRNKFRCRKREKRKKKRKCRDDEDESDDCQHAAPKKKQKPPGKCEEGEEDDECQKRLHMIRKKRKSRNGESENYEKDKKRKKRLKKKFSDKSKTVKYKCENSESPICGKRQDDGRGHKEPEAEKTAEDYDGEGFTDGPDPDDETAMDFIYDWTTSAAVQD